MFIRDNVNLIFFHYRNPDISLITPELLLMADDIPTISKDEIKNDDTGSVDSGRMSRREVVAYDSEDESSRYGEPGTVTGKIPVENADDHHQLSDVSIVAHRGSPEEADDANKGQSSASLGSEQRSMTGCESDTEYDRLSRLQSAGKVSNVYSDGKRILSAGGGVIPLDSGYRDSVSFRSTSAESRNRPEFISVALSEEPVHREINSASSVRGNDYPDGDNTGTAACDVTSLRSQQGLTVDEKADCERREEPTKPVIMSSSTTSINSASSSSRTTDKLKSKIENANLLLPNNSIDLVQNKPETRILHSSMGSVKDNADVKLDTGATKPKSNSASSQRSSTTDGGSSNATDTIPLSKKSLIVNNDIGDAESKVPQPQVMAKKVKRKRQISASTAEHQASPYFPARPPRPTSETNHPSDSGGPTVSATFCPSPSVKTTDKSRQKQKGLHDVTKKAYNQPLSGLSSERGKNKQIKGRNYSAPRKARSVSESSKDSDGGQQSNTLANLHPSRTTSNVSLKKTKNSNQSEQQQNEDAVQTKQTKICESVSVNSSTASIKSSLFLGDIYRELKTFIDVVDNEESSKGNTNTEQPKKSERFQARRQGLESMLESIGSYSTKIGSIVAKLNDCMQELRTEIREELSVNKDSSNNEGMFIII